MSEATYLTRDEAAIACGVHVDTIRRDQREGEYPNARQRPDGKWEIPVSDLVAKGRLNPMAANAPHVEIVTKPRIEREVFDLRLQLSQQSGVVLSLEGMLARADEEIKFLRGLLRERAT
jgi:hypothetical protein